jgi:hypothetical protein
VGPLDRADQAVDLHVDQAGGDLGHAGGEAAGALQGAELGDHGREVPAAAGEDLEAEGEVVLVVPGGGEQGFEGAALGALAFAAARRGFDEAGLPFAAALAHLELVAVWVRQGRTEQVYRAVGRLVETFRQIGIEREALGAVLLLAEALEHDGLSLELVEAAIRVLRRLERRQPQAGRAA